MFGFLMGGTLVEYLGYKTAFIACGGLYVAAYLILLPVKSGRMPPKKNLVTARQNSTVHGKRLLQRRTPLQVMHCVRVPVPSGGMS